MKKDYLPPAMETLLIDVADVLTTSGDEVTSGPFEGWRDEF